MSKLFDLLEILKELEVLESLIKAQEDTVRFVEARLQNKKETDDEERLKMMGENSAHDIKILKPHHKELREKFEVLLQAAIADPKFMTELDSVKIPEDYKKAFESVKNRLESEQGKERPQE